MPSPPDLVVPEAPQRAPGLRRELWWFLAWMVTGFFYLVSVLAMLDHQGVTSWYIGRLVELNVGLVLALAAGMTTALLLIRESLRWAGSGLSVGGGLSCLWIGWLNRGGPGSVCTPIVRGLTRCISESNGKVWLLAGLLSLTLAVALGVRAWRQPEGESATNSLN
jgi:hypothetical protein